MHQRKQTILATIATVVSLLIVFRIRYPLGLSIWMQIVVLLFLQVVIFFSLVLLAMKLWPDEGSGASEKVKYTCEGCGNSVDSMAESQKLSPCCGKPIKKKSELPGCDKTVTAEQERLHEDDEPCDDATRNT